MDENWHGTPGGYSNHKCRCDECRFRWNDYIAEYRKGKMAELSGVTHGKTNSYSLGCRCDLCKTAARDYKRGRSSALKRVTRPRGISCECCGKETDRLVLDHNHHSGLFRGWLCHTCNTGIGKLGDSVEGLERAMMYLRANPGVE